MTITLTAALCAVALAVSPAAWSFGGARMLAPGAGIGLSFGGVAFPRVSCAAGTTGFCRGWVTIRQASDNRRLGRAPIAVRSFDSPSVEVRLRGSRAQILRHGRVPVIVTTRTHDNADPPAYRTFAERSYLRR
jgi:hypothetical protein